MELTELLQILCCPVCAAPLNAEAVEGETCWSCTRSSCRYSKVGAILHVRGQPVLIDFDRSIVSERSFLNRGGGSPIDRRRSGFINWLKTRILYSDSVGRTRRNARRLVAQLRKQSPRPLILVIGGGTRGLGADELVGAADLDVISFDIYASDHTDFVADAHTLPLTDAAVDGIWIQNVLEHVLDPRRVVQEITRVLRVDGTVFSEIPFLQQVHEGPFDFTRLTHSGHRYLFGDFDELESGVGMGSGSHLQWAIEYTIRGVTRSRRVGKAAKLLFTWLRVLDYFIPDAYAIDCASSTYFLGRKRDDGPTPHPSYIVGFYRGADQRV